MALKLKCLTVLLAAVTSLASAKRCFPDEFVFGSAVSAYQVEGAWNETNREPNVWDISCREEEDVACANVATDFVHRYPEDIQLMKDFNLDTFRFSVSWSRAMNWNNETQKMEPNPEGLAYYHALVDDLIAHNIQPIMTIYHLDLPYQMSLFEPSGWLNDDMVGHFNDYVSLLFTEFGHKVPYFATFNEPYYVVFLFYSGETDPYTVAHNVLLSHGTAVQTFRAFQEEGIVSADARISLVLNLEKPLPLDPENEKDVDAAERATEFGLGWFLQPIVSGEYPQVMRDRVGDRLPNFTAEESDMLAGSYDLFMLNHYGSTLATDCNSEDSTVSCDDLAPGIFADSGVDSTILPEGTLLSATDEDGNHNCVWFSGYPKGYGELIRWMHKRDTSAEILLTENGYCGNETIDNSDQVWYFQNFVDQVYQVMTEDKIPVIGYTAWSFMDNYEWGSYKPRFGLNYVEYPAGVGTVDGYTPKPSDLKRTPRTAAKWFAKLAETGCIEDADAAIGYTDGSSNGSDAGSSSTIGSDDDTCNDAGCDDDDNDDDNNDGVGNGGDDNDGTEAPSDSHDGMDDGPASTPSATTPSDGNQGDDTPASTPATTPSSTSTAVSGDCVEVSVEHDATYCIDGPICSGSGSEPAGYNCPTQGATAIADCHDYLLSASDQGSCILPADAQCQRIGTGAWGCVLTGSHAATDGTTSSTEGTVGNDKDISTETAGLEGSGAGASVGVIGAVAAISGVVCIAVGTLLYKKYHATKSTVVYENTANTVLTP